MNGIRIAWNQDYNFWKTISYFFILFLHYLYVYFSFTNVFVILFCCHHIFLYLCFISVLRTMQTSGMEHFCKIVKSLVVNCFCRELHLGCLHWLKRNKWLPLICLFIILLITNGAYWFLSWFNISNRNMLIMNSSCKWLDFCRNSYCKSCNWKRHTLKYFTKKLMFFILNTL